MNYKQNDKIIQAPTKFKGQLFEKGKKKKKERKKQKYLNKNKFKFEDSITMKYRCNVDFMEY